MESKRLSKVAVELGITVAEILDYLKQNHKLRTINANSKVSPEMFVIIKNWSDPIISERKQRTTSKKLFGDLKAVKKSEKDKEEDKKKYWNLSEKIKSSESTYGNW